MTQAVGINFHQTFKPEKHYISAIIEIAEDHAFKSVKEISQITGIPTGTSSGKVEPHIQYAAFMGLITYEKKDGEYSLKRTDIGEIVYVEDPGLQENLTILLCHCMMQREKAGALMWSSVFRKVMPRYKTGIKKNMLLMELNSVLEGNVTVKNLAPFYGSYDSFFDSLGILMDDGDTVEVSALAYDRDFIYLYAYVLFEYWAERYPDHDEITSDELKDLNFGIVFGWDTQEEYNVLESLSDKGLIRMNRQLMPYTVLKLVESEDLAGKLFNELC